MHSPERKNDEAIERLERALRELRSNPSTARETEAIREIGLEIAVAVREIGAMLVEVAWQQAHPTSRAEEDAGPVGGGVVPGDRRDRSPAGGPGATSEVEGG